MSSEQTKAVSTFVGSIKDLPTLPTVLEKIVSLTNDPNVSINQIEQAISTDPVISTKLLRIVNSAYFSFFREITSLKQAIVVLGLEATKNLVYGTSIISAFGRETRIKQFPLNGFWKYSVACGNISRTLASLLDYSFYEEAFLAGLVHNIGKIVLARFKPEEFETAIETAIEKQVPLSSAEREIIGFDHSSVGYELATRWRLPQLLDDTIRYYEEPDQAENNRDLCAIVRLASLLCRMYQIGTCGEPEFSGDIQQDISWAVLSRENDMLEVLDFDRFQLTLNEEIEKVDSFVQSVFSDVK
jgi:HD-like signal output (HDOD) protein